MAAHIVPAFHVRRHLAYARRRHAFCAIPSSTTSPRPPHRAETPWIRYLLRGMMANQPMRWIALRADTQPTTAQRAYRSSRPPILGCLLPANRPTGQPAKRPTGQAARGACASPGTRLRLLAWSPCRCRPNGQPANWPTGCCHPLALSGIFASYPPAATSPRGRRVSGEHWAYPRIAPWSSHRTRPFRCAALIDDQASRPRQRSAWFFPPMPLTNRNIPNA
jgi:hypothetical protein